MALPPDPLDDALPTARHIVVGEVLAVEDLGPWPGAGPAIDAAPARPAQRVRVHVVRALRGQPAAPDLWVHKPAAAYALTAGVHGPFLLDDALPEPRILGRYGPDTWSEEQVVDALARHDVRGDA